MRDQPGNQLGEDRRTIFVHHDADLKAAYPLRVGGDGASSPALADLDGDGAADIVFGTSDGLVHAKRADGTDLPGWPAAGDPLPLQPRLDGVRDQRRSRRPRGAILASVAIGDIDGDGLLDVVAADMEGKVYAWNHQGVRKAGLPGAGEPRLLGARGEGPAQPRRPRHHRVAGARRPRRRRRARRRSSAATTATSTCGTGSASPRPGFPVLVVDATPHGVDRSRSTTR